MSVVLPVATPAVSPDKERSPIVEKIAEFVSAYAAQTLNLTTMKPQDVYSSATECAMNSHIETSVHPTDRERIRDLARRDLVSVLEKTRGCVVELIMKDISTRRHQPQRIWEWCDMAMQVAEEYA